MSEVEVIAFVHLAGIQLLLQDPFGKLARSQQGEIASEREQEDCINSCAGEQSELFGRWGKEFKGGIGSKNADGMRLEGDGHGLRVLLPGAVSNISQDGLMRPVDAVKIAHADDRIGPKAAGTSSSLWKTCIDVKKPKSIANRKLR